MMSPCVKAAYRLITAAATPFVAAHLLVRQAMGKESSTRLRERWGHATIPRPRGRLVWLHAASLGEGAAALPLIMKILEESPSTNILVTGGSVAADEWRRRAFPGKVIRQFVPVDTPAAVQRFVSHWKPDVGIFVESELWPNLIETSAANGVALALVNARISASSARMWSYPIANRLFRETARHFCAISSQNRRERRRLVALGAPRAAMTHPADLKLVSAASATTRVLDTETIDVKNIIHRHARVDTITDSTRCIGDGDAGASELPKKKLTSSSSSSAPRHHGLEGGEPLWWLATSTHEGEEAACARIHLRLRARFSNMLTCVIVPRHVERAAAVCDELRAPPYLLDVRRFSSERECVPGTIRGNMMEEQEQEREQEREQRENVNIGAGGGGGGGGGGESAATMTGIGMKSGRPVDVPPPSPPPPPLQAQAQPPDVLVIDILGVLPHVYVAARGRPVFVGGSMYPGSKGHNVAEATMAGCAVLVGPHHETFESMINDINGEGGNENDDDDDDDDREEMKKDKHKDKDDDEYKTEAAAETKGSKIASAAAVAVAVGGEVAVRACEVVTSENELCLGVEARLADVDFAAASGEAGTTRTLALQRGVLERLWSALSEARLFSSLVPREEGDRESTERRKI